jgi:hypothetical protein
MRRWPVIRTDLEPNREQVRDSAAQDRSARKAVSPIKRRPPWSSSWAKAPSGAGALNHLPKPKIVQGVEFIDGLEIPAMLEAPQAKFAAA